MVSLSLKLKGKVIYVKLMDDIKEKFIFYEIFYRPDGITADLFKILVYWYISKQICIYKMYILSPLYIIANVWNLYKSLTCTLKHHWAKALKQSNRAASHRHTQKCSNESRNMKHSVPLGHNFPQIIEFIEWFFQREFVKS